jgi:hypothetical protein
MASDREEPNRVLGMPRRTAPQARQGAQARQGTQARQGEEQQHVMGFPADWFGSVDLDWVASLAHPVRGYKRWARRRRLGPYLTDEDEP